MQRRQFITLLGGTAAAWPLAAHAQQPAKLPTKGPPVRPGTGSGGSGYSINVKDFGVVGNGVTNDRPAIQALIDRVSTSSRGLIFFPLGTYAIDGPLRLDQMTHEDLILTGEGANIETGRGSAIVGNFPDFLIKRGPGYDTASHKVIQRLTLANGHPAGGAVLLSGQQNGVVRDCAISAGAYGVIFDKENGPHSVVNCMFRQSGTPSVNSVGIQLSGTGGLAMNNNFQGWGDCIRMMQGGNAVIGNRIEISRRGVVGGVTPQGQYILGTANNGSGGTRLTVTSTAAFVPWDPVVITDYWGVGSNILGTWPRWTLVDAAHIDIPVAFQPLPSGAMPLIGGALGYRLAANACVIQGNTFEADDYSIFCESLSNSVISGFQIQGHQTAPSGVSTAGIYIRGGHNLVIQGGLIVGGHTLGGIYQETGTTTWGNVIQATDSGADILYFVGRYTNTPGPFTLALGAWYKLPDWLLPGLTVGQIIGNASVPPGTKVQSVTNTTITLDHPISGSLVDNNGISFVDGSGREVGGVFLR